ncbi:hypothetical protein JNUCC83_01545 [Vagococcus sp. JNUCC 83]
MYLPTTVKTSETGTQIDDDSLSNEEPVVTPKDPPQEEPLPFENQQETDAKENKSDGQKKEASQKSQSDEPIGFIAQTSTHNKTNSSNASQVYKKPQSGLAKILPKTGELTELCLVY